MQSANRVIVVSMSGLVVAISLLLMVAMLGGMRRGNAEWDIIAIAGTAVGLLTLAVTIVWRTFAARIRWWEAAAQYAVSGGLLAGAAFTHMFYGLSVTYSQAHLIVSAFFCVWNLAWIFRAGTEQR